MASSDSSAQAAEEARRRQAEADRRAVEIERLREFERARHEGTQGQ